MGTVIDPVDRAMKLLPIKPRRPRTRRVNTVLPLQVSEWLRDGDEFSVKVKGLDAGIPGDPRPVTGVHVVGLLIDEVENE